MNEAELYQYLYRLLAKAEDKMCEHERVPNFTEAEQKAFWHGWYRGVYEVIHAIDAINFEKEK